MRNPAFALIEKTLGRKAGSYPSDWADRHPMSGRTGRPGKQLIDANNLAASAERHRGAGGWCWPPNPRISTQIEFVGSQAWWQRSAGYLHMLGGCTLSWNQQDWGFVPCPDCYHACAFRKPVDRKAFGDWIADCFDRFIAVQHPDGTDWQRKAFSEIVWPIHFREYHSANWTSIAEEPGLDAVPGDPDWIIVEFHLSNCRTCASQCVAPRCTVIPPCPLRGMIKLPPIENRQAWRYRAAYPDTVYRGPGDMETIVAMDEDGGCYEWQGSGQPDAELWSSDGEIRPWQEVRNVAEMYVRTRSMMLRERLFDLVACDTCGGTGHQWFVEFSDDEFDDGSGDAYFDEYGEPESSRYRVHAHDEPWNPDGPWRQKLRPPEGTEAFKEECSVCNGSGVIESAVEEVRRVVPAPPHGGTQGKTERHYQVWRMATLKEFIQTIDNLFPMTSDRKTWAHRPPI